MLTFDRRVSLKTLQEGLHGSKADVEHRQRCKKKYKDSAAAMQSSEADDKRELWRLVDEKQEFGRPLTRQYVYNNGYW